MNTAMFSSDVLREDVASHFRQYCACIRKGDVKKMLQIRNKTQGWLDDHMEHIYDTIVVSDRVKVEGDLANQSVETIMLEHSQFARIHREEGDEGDDRVYGIVVDDQGAETERVLIEGDHKYLSDDEIRIEYNRFLRVERRQENGKWVTYGIQEDREVKHVDLYNDETLRMIMAMAPVRLKYEVKQKYATVYGFRETTEPESIIIDGDPKMIPAGTILFTDRQDAEWYVPGWDGEKQDLGRLEKNGYHFTVCTDEADTRFGETIAVHQVKAVQMLRSADDQQAAKHLHWGDSEGTTHVFRDGERSALSLQSIFGETIGEEYFEHSDQPGINLFLDGIGYETFLYPDPEFEMKLLRIAHGHEGEWSAQDLRQLILDYVERSVQTGAGKPGSAGCLPVVASAAAGFILGAGALEWSDGNRTDDTQQIIEMLVRQLARDEDLRTPADTGE